MRVIRNPWMHHASGKPHVIRYEIVYVDLIHVKDCRQSHIDTIVRKVCLSGDRLWTTSEVAINKKKSVAGSNRILHIVVVP